MRRLGILALAVVAACALPLAGCLDIRDKDGMINTQPPIEAGKDTEDENNPEARPTDGGAGPSSSMQQETEEPKTEADDAGSAWLETDDEFPIDLEADENIHVRAECKDTDGYGDAAVLFTV